MEQHQIQAIARQAVTIADGAITIDIQSLQRAHKITDVHARVYGRELAGRIKGAVERTGVSANLQVPTGAETVFTISGEFKKDNPGLSQAVERECADMCSPEDMKRSAGAAAEIAAGERKGNVPGSGSGRRH